MPRRPPVAEHVRLRHALVNLLAKRMWDYLEAQPGFNEGMRAAEAELAAGGGVLYRVYRNRLRKVRR